MDDLALLMKRLQGLTASQDERDHSTRPDTANAGPVRVQNNHGVIAGSILGPVAIGANSRASTVSHRESDLAKSNEELLHASHLPRDRVFISYSSQGQGSAWAPRLEQTLSTHVATKNASIWYDAHIEPGELWRDAIDDALARTKVALLLVDDAFVASPFVGFVELPSFMRDAKSSGLTILWILIEGDTWQNTPLAGIQRLLPRHPPLASLRDSPLTSALDEIAQQVARALE